MPIYEFVCRDCDIKFEELIFKQDDIHHLACPDCQGNNYRRVFSAFGFRSSGGTGRFSCSSCTASSCAGCH